MHGFNGSIWHAAYVLAPLWAAIFLCTYRTLKGNYYYFDPKHNNDHRLKAEGGDFEQHSKRYQDLAKLAITLSAASIGFLISMATGDKDTPVVASLKSVTPIVIGFFAACIALLIFFMLLQSYFYESYCHSPDHSTYRRWQYAFNVSMGWTGLLAMILGFLWLGNNLRF